MQENIYKVLDRWEFPEYIKYKKTKKWWFLFVFLNIIFVIGGFLTDNITTVILILLIIDIILLFREFDEPDNIEIIIYSNGVYIDKKLYEWKDIDSFWIVYNPPDIKKLYFSFKNKFKAPFYVPLENKNPLKIRKILGDYIKEDLEQEDELTIDSLGRILKI